MSFRTATRSRTSATTTNMRPMPPPPSPRDAHRRRQRMQRRDPRPTPPALSERYREALDRGLISVGDIDRALTRLFSARIRNGDLPGIRTNDACLPSAAVRRARNTTAGALDAAEKSLVLLKNDGVLPLRRAFAIAVIGPLGDATRVLRGNYSAPMSGPAHLGARGPAPGAMPGASITYAPVGASLHAMATGYRPRRSARRTAHRGLLARYYNATSHPRPAFRPGRGAQDPRGPEIRLHAVAHAARGRRGGRGLVAEGGQRLSSRHLDRLHRATGERHLPPRPERHGRRA